MKLLKIDDITDSNLLSLQKEFRRSKELIHGCNGFLQADKLSTWRKTVKKIEHKPPKNKAKTSQFFIVNDENQLIGVIDFRFRLLPYQELDGGHISYTIRKSERGKGYGKEALKRILEVAKKETNLKEVLLTCNNQNILSEKIIQSCGGTLEKTIFINNSYINHYRIRL